MAQDKDELDLKASQENALASLLALQATVDAFLPKDGNGVSIYPGDTVWRNGNEFLVSTVALTMRGELYLKIRHQHKGYVENVFNPKDVQVDLKSRAYAMKG